MYILHTTPVSSNVLHPCKPFVSVLSQTLVSSLKLQDYLCPQVVPHSPFHTPHSLHQISKHCILQYLSKSPWHTDEHIPNGSWWKWESIPFQDLWMVSCHKPRLSFSETDFCSSLFPSFSGIVQRIIPTTLSYIPRSLNTNTIFMQCVSKSWTDLVLNQTMNKIPN